LYKISYERLKWQLLVFYSSWPFLTQLSIISLHRVQFGWVLAFWRANNKRLYSQSFYFYYNVFQKITNERKRGKKERWSLSIYYLSNLKVARELRRDEMKLSRGEMYIKYVALKVMKNGCCRMYCLVVLLVCFFTYKLHLFFCIVFNFDFNFLFLDFRNKFHLLVSYTSHSLHTSYNLQFLYFTSYIYKNFWTFTLLFLHSFSSNFFYNFYILHL